MQEPIKLAIADDSSIFRDILRKYLASYPNIQIVIEASDGRELIKSLKKRRTLPDVIILDLIMPVMGGMETLDYLYLNYPLLKTLIITAHKDEKTSRELIKRGARGFFEKNMDIERLPMVIWAVVNDLYHFNGWNLPKIVTHEQQVEMFPPEACGIAFTEQELKIIELICRQYTSRKIAELLSLSTRTVEGHRAKIFRKTNTDNIIGLFTFATKYNLVNQYQL